MHKPRVMIQKIRARREARRRRDAEFAAARMFDPATVNVYDPESVERAMAYIPEHTRRRYERDRG